MYTRVLGLAVKTKSEGETLATVCESRDKVALIPAPALRGDSRKLTPALTEKVLVVEPDVILTVPLSLAKTSA